MSRMEILALACGYSVFCFVAGMIVGSDLSHRAWMKMTKEWLETRK